ncbi:MAG: hypothetical protein HXX09_16920 [Bacteroidetes bacterium]|nr:hypothetical protein [Bacteroidota bacterium]
MKKFLILFILLSTACFAQDDVYKSSIKKTSIAIYSAQKNMLASNSNDVNGKLAKAILFQSNSIKYYKEKDNALSSCYTLRAREMAIEIIQLLTQNKKDDPYFQITLEEKGLNLNCLGGDQLYLKGKSSFPDYSGFDKDFLDPLSIKKYIDVD